MGQDAKDYEGHFANYAEYSKTFRSWMVAYGIGGPVLFLTNKDAPAAIAKSPDFRWIVGLFVVGVALQILLALINKWAAWHMYMGAFSKFQLEQNDSDCSYHHESWFYGLWNWINKQSWIDFLIDVGALSVFAIATWLSLKALAGL